MRLALVLVLLFAAACGSARRGEPVIGPVSFNEKQERGRALFDRHCHKCHTHGEGGLAPAINDKPLPKFMMRLQTRVGMGAMPSFSRQQISDEELDALLDYLVALRRAGR